MIDNTILNNFHNKAFIIYTNEDWCSFLLKINPYLSIENSPMNNTTKQILLNFLK